MSTQMLPKSSDRSGKDLLTIVWIRLSMLSTIHSISSFYIMYQMIQMPPKRYLWMTVDELPNGGVEIAEMGHGGKQLDFMYDLDAPHLSLGMSNSCCFLASQMPRPASSLLPQEKPAGTASPPCIPLLHNQGLLFTNIMTICCFVHCSTVALGSDWLVEKARLVNHLHDRKPRYY
jgi:hypothetical protein